MPDTHMLATAGSHETDIPVSISYRIIELFSGGLYSSPNKAIEELVANSYDAMATNVHVIMPADTQSQEALIWVIDDGMSMDSAGLRDLWRIASSTKRLPGMESKERPPIGKFGIGKLATYVLARHLTYVCKSKGMYRAVTMDFSELRPDDDADTVFTLPVRILTEDEAVSLLALLLYRHDDAADAIKLFGPGAAGSWTVAAMGNLTSLAQGLTSGRLGWVLSTALPINPEFNLFLNGNRLHPSKTKLKPLEEWVIGVDDKVAERLRLRTEADPYAVHIEGVGPVSGSVAIYEDPLTGGKAGDWGRSHGIFVMVRKRLVNIDDALFGLPQLSLGPFARFRMEVYADGLDGVLRSTRETVLESEGVHNLQKYILDKFNEVRTWYNNWLTEKEYEARISTRIGATPQSLSRRPLLNAIRRVLDGAPDLLLTQIPPNLSAEAKQTLLSRLEADIDSDTGLIKEVRFEPLGINIGLAIFDALQGCVCVNLLHPFYANYIEHYHNSEPFELLAVAEVLTEAYLLDEGLSSEATKNVLRKRDRFLRELVYSRQLAAPLVADLLRATVANPSGLEQAVAAGLASIGFEVSPIGGNGEPDGLAVATLGVRDPASGVSSDYRITYDTKSTGKTRVKAHTVGTGTIARHGKNYDADYRLVIAPGFEGAGYSNSAIAQEAVQQDITMVTVEDFIRLVLVCATRQLGFTRLRDFFETCRNPVDAKEWIDRILQEEPQAGPLQEILETVWKLVKESPDPVKFAAVQVQLRIDYPDFGSIREADIRDWMQTLRRLAGGYVTVENDVVSLEAPPQRILQEIRNVSHRLPSQFQYQSMVRMLVDTGAPNG